MLLATFQGLHAVRESVSILLLFHVTQTDSTISVSFPESQLLLCLAVVNCLRKLILEQKFKMYNEIQKQFLSIFHYFHNALPSFSLKLFLFVFKGGEGEKGLFTVKMQTPLFSLILFRNSVIIHKLLRRFTDNLFSITLNSFHCIFPLGFPHYNGISNILADFAIDLFLC